MLAAFAGSALSATSRPPVEGGELVEVDDVVVQGVGRDQEVPDVLGVQRISSPRAFSTARTDTMACTVVQTPQILCV